MVLEYLLIFTVYSYINNYSKPIKNTLEQDLTQNLDEKKEKC
ncbi:MAG: hypothetical protein ACTSPA_07180 [Promethearchaeota archaeon]